MVRFIASLIIFFYILNLSVLRAVNKANNPECQGNGNHLRKNRTPNRKTKPVKKREKFQVIHRVHKPFTEDQKVIHADG